MFAEMGVALKEDGNTLGIFSPKKVRQNARDILLQKGKATRSGYTARRRGGNTIGIFSPEKLWPHARDILHQESEGTSSGQAPPPLPRILGNMLGIFSPKLRQHDRSRNFRNVINCLLWLSTCMSQKAQTPCTLHLIFGMDRRLP